MNTVLSIKNMVCARCVRAVDEIVRSVGIIPADIRLGEVRTDSGISDEQRERLRAELEKEGFELLDDKRRQLIESIKHAIIDLVHNGDEETLATVRISEYLRSALHTDYAVMSSLFSQLEGLTLEKYVIHQKIERVKELMMYDEQRLGEIAHRLGYSSVHHLSNQFKRVTGMTPTEFKKSYRVRVPLDKVGHA
jgi:AraC-like DNA-binding protein